MPIPHAIRRLPAESLLWSARTNGEGARLNLAGLLTKKRTFAKRAMRFVSVQGLQLALSTES